MGPKDMTEEEVAYWDSVIKRMVESDSWKDFEGAGWRVFIRIVGRVGFLEECHFRYEEMVKKRLKREVFNQALFL